MKILIADDNHTDRIILYKILLKFNHEVIVAVDGVEAVQLFKTGKPDLILMDALMPNMNGFEAAIAIKKASGDNLIPIIFLTSLKSPADLARCLEVGGDDFLTKPYNQLILQAKLKAFERMKSLYDEVKHHRNETVTSNKRLLHEQEVAKRVFDNIAHGGTLIESNIRFLLSPMSVFNGDLLLCAKTPSGSTHLLLGDFTGHGLPAAIGAMPVAEIFYGMTTKGFSIADIITEINTRLFEILPVGVFCCATACEINYRERMLIIWSGGLPDCYIVSPGVGIIQTIPSVHLPLGVLNKSSFSVKTDVILFEDNDKIYITSDGILEAESPSGEMFGEQRLKDILSIKDKQRDVFTSLLSTLSDFSQSDAQTDDLTLIEYRFNTPQQTPSKTEYQSKSDAYIQSLDWSLEYEFRQQSLKTLDPLPLVLQIIRECPGLSPYRSRIFTILAELYSNAIDHGVLKLDSNLKSSDAGFVEYYQQRKKKLEKLDTGFVRVKMEHIPSEEGGDLSIQVIDSGLGFDYTNINKSNNKFSGRGLALIDSLCDSLDYSDNGRAVTAVFSWQRPDFGEQ